MMPQASNRTDPRVPVDCNICNDTGKCPECLNRITHRDHCTRCGRTGSCPDCDLWPELVEGCTGPLTFGESRDQMLGRFGVVCVSREPFV